MPAKQPPVRSSEVKHDEDGPYCEIEIKGGAVAKVDPEWFWSFAPFNWCDNGHGYAGRRRRQSDGPGPIWIMMHRQVMGFPKGGIDHRNTDRLDNRQGNLRLAEQRDNSRNRSGWRKATSSKYKGVAFVKRCKSKPWLAQIKVNRKLIYLGYHATEEAAARAYDDAAREHFGEFAKPNFPAG